MSGRRTAWRVPRTARLPVRAEACLPAPSPPHPRPLSHPLPPDRERGSGGEGATAGKPTVAPRLAGLLLGLALLIAGCGHKPTTSADIAVSIDGEEISQRHFEAYLRRQVESEDLELDSEVLSRLFDQFLDGQLLIRLAIERGLVERRLPNARPPATGPPAAGLEGSSGSGGEGLSPEAPRPPPMGAGSAGESGVDERRAVAFLLRNGLEEASAEEEVEAYYTAHLDEFRRPEEVYLRQILAHDRARAVSAQEALAAGEAFAQVAARFSQGPKASLGGDQGRLSQDDLPAVFIDAIFDLEPGGVSDIVTADYGFLIFQVVERYPAETASLEQVAGEIRQALQRQHVDELVAGFVAEARARYNVKVFPDNFPFEYRGSYQR